MSHILEVKDLLVYRGKKKVLELKQLEVEPGEVLAVIGPNGAGKSTLLLSLSQLLKPVRGQFFFQGRQVDHRSAKRFRQHIALVLQEPLLLDATVFENVTTGLRFRHLSRHEISERVDLWLERLGISHLRDSSAKRISGGEAQRVSLARALVIDPDILLLDEPFSALDAPTRLSLLEDFQTIINDTHITTIFVTHDQDEALLLGDRVAVFLDGKLQQIGTPQVVFCAPANPQVAAFVGVETVIPGIVLSNDDGLVQVAADTFHLEAVGEVEAGRQVFLCLRPEDITLWGSEDIPTSSARNSLRGHIMRLTPQGPLVRVALDCGFPLVALVTKASVDGMGLEPGQKLQASFKATAAHLIAR
jgi:tungstate transport system ATP-binding protein